ncbi:MAG: DNA adenine methylase [Anaerolineae bacterium]|nr:DNA adenine methylase [Anaerolineae bacterium]
MTDSQNTIPAKPFLKWAGGKSQLLAQYARFFPTEPMRAYFEPFVGSGAVFFHLRERALFEQYTLSEINTELITCYEAVRDHVGVVIERLAEHNAHHSRDHYYAVRALDRDPAWPTTPSTERAARLIYLNKTCYNGLWRVNSKGYFNVPMGRYKNPDIFNESRLRAASRALQHVTVAARPFEAVLDHAGPGDCVYFDPPYVPLSATANFTSYAADAFGEHQQRQLAGVFAALAARGCRVLLSNSDTPLVRDLYAHFQIETVEARRQINSKAGKRGTIHEVLVLGNTI